MANQKSRRTKKKPATTCARCGAPLDPAQPQHPDRVKHFCSFRCEVLDLFTETDDNIPGLIISMLWGFLLLAFLGMLSWGLSGRPIDQPGPYWGLTAVLGVLTAIGGGVWWRNRKRL